MIIVDNKLMSYNNCSIFSLDIPLNIALSYVWFLVIYTDSYLYMIFSYLYFYTGCSKKGFDKIKGIIVPINANNIYYGTSGLIAKSALHPWLLIPR